MIEQRLFKDIIGTLANNGMDYWTKQIHRFTYDTCKPPTVPFESILIFHWFSSN